MTQLSPRKLRIWFWIAAFANFLSLMSTMLPGFGHHTESILIVFLTIQFSLVTLICLPRIVFAGTILEKIVASLLAVLPLFALIMFTPIFFVMCRR